MLRRLAFLFYIRAGRFIRLRRFAGCSIDSGPDREQGAIGRARDVTVEKFTKVEDERTVRVCQHEVEDSGPDNQLASFIVEAFLFLPAFLSSPEPLFDLFFPFEQGFDFIRSLWRRHEAIVAPAAPRLAKPQPQGKAAYRALPLPPASVPEMDLPRARKSLPLRNGSKSCFGL